MKKDTYIIKCEKENYDILYLRDSFQIGKIQKGVNENEIQIPEIRAVRDNNKELKLGEGRVGLTFMSARTCNLRCRYCYAGEGEYGNVEEKPKMLTAEIYMKSVEMVLREYPEGIKTIAFFGGEPLINFKEIKRFVLELVESFKNKNIECPKLSIITNLVLLTDEMAEFFKEYKVLIAISLDGGKKLNDLSRIGYTKDSVYDQVMERVRCLKRHGVKFVLQATLNRNHLKNYTPGYAVEWAKSIEEVGCSNYLAIPVESEFEDLTVENDLDTLEAFIRELTNYSLNKLVSDDPGVVPTGIVAPIFQIVNKKITGNCTAGHSLLIDTDGNIYPCQMFCNNTEACIGNVDTELSESSIKNYANVSRHNSHDCQNCIAKNICVVFCKGIQLLSNGNMYKVCKPRCVYQKAIMEECIKFLARLDKTSIEYTNLLKNYKMISERLMEDGFTL